ncbi:hypothetical protein GCM10023321_73170 [Pseudonocardia eucalypti]|uniref:Uncharacterized protein n=1 Tax=Pseudonocardia eucalypti TaxID=648755 RepID=A0ABP9R7Y4_9PSEU
MDVRDRVGKCAGSAPGGVVELAVSRRRAQFDDRRGQLLERAEGAVRQAGDVAHPAPRGVGVRGDRGPCLAQPGFQFLREPVNRLRGGFHGRRNRLAGAGGPATPVHQSDGDQ